MAVIKPLNIFKVATFDDFCIQFKISSNIVAGENETDEELIAHQLETYNNRWLINFIEDRNDGYFLLQEIIE